MAEMRVGSGYDAHRFGGDGPVVLCGVEIEHPVGIEGTSDGDVAAHAVSDAILGAAALGDIGQHFPSSDTANAGARSVDFAERCARMVRDRGLELINVDVTIIAQEVQIAPHRDEMRRALGAALRLSPTHVSVKGTTTDRLGWIGAGEGIAAHAVALILR